MHAFPFTPTCKSFDHSFNTLINPVPTHDVVLAMNALTSLTDFDPDFVAVITTKDQHDNLIHIVLDTGCTFAISPEEKDFTVYQPSHRSSIVKTVGGPTTIEGHRMVEWTLVSKDGQLTGPCCKNEISIPTRFLSIYGFVSVL
jgi:hypothetical protein